MRCIAIQNVKTDILYAISVNDRFLRALVFNPQGTGRGYRQGDRGGIRRNGIQNGCFGILVSEEGIEGAPQVIRCTEAADLEENNIAETVDNHGDRNAIRFGIFVQLMVSVTAHGKGQAVFLAESRDDFVCVFGLLGKGNESHLVLVFLIYIVDCRELVPAGSAPGSPEVDQYRFVIFQRLRKGKGISVDIRYGEILERFPQERGPVLRGSGNGKEQGKGAVALRGKMIDAPIVARAQQTIAMAEELGLGRSEA
jgi:hypothetical protein